MTCALASACGLMSVEIVGPQSWSLMPRVSIALCLPTRQLCTQPAVLSCFDCGLLHAFLSVVHPSQQANITSHCSLVGVSPAVFLYACTSALFSFSVLNSCPCISAFFCTCGRVSEPGLVMHAVQVVCHRAIPQACLHAFMHKGTVWALER